MNIFLEILVLILVHFRLVEEREFNVTERLKKKAERAEREAKVRRVCHLFAFFWNVSTVLSMLSVLYVSIHLTFESFVCVYVIPYCELVTTVVD